MRSLVSSIFILLLFVACNAKEGDSGGLVSGHLPSTNTFSLQTPATKTFIAGETISINVTFPFDMVINTGGGNPQLNITVGATARVATYNPGADPRVLNFRYTVVAAENDTDGVTVNSLSLNGSTIQFDSNGTMTNCDVSTVTTKRFSGVKVDTAGPTITGLALTNLPGFYNVGEAIQYTMTFNEPVILTGTPKFTTTLSTGGAVDTTYISGSGTSILRFGFTISGTHADSDGYVITSPLDIGAGTMKDAVGNDANLSFVALVAAVQTYSSGVKIGGQYPYIETVTVPANGTYLAADDLDVEFIFDRSVNVTGTPYVNLTIGSNTRQAQYVSGSGTDTLVFRYTAIPGDVDADGIAVATSITQNGGDIRDVGGTNVSFFGDALNNSYIVPSTTGVILNALQPQAISVTRNTDTTLPIFGGASADNVWIIGQVIYITVGFNTPMYVTQTGGTPSLSMTVGATNREAPYLSGGNGQTNLVFSYTIQEGDLDTDNTIVLNSILLNGGIIADAQNTNSLLTLPASLTSTKFDGVRPTISSMASPAAGTYSLVAPLNNMAFVITWSEAVNYSATTLAAAYFPVDIGGTIVNAGYVSGNNTATLTHNVNLTGRNDSNGVTVSSPFAGTATIRDAAGNAANVFTFTPPDTSLVLVDTTAPTVVSITQTTANGTYKAGETLDFLVTFSESVTTLVAGGYPRIPITIGAMTRYLTPTANATSTTHTFRYTIVANEVDTNGVAVGTAITHNGVVAYARDGGRNNSTGSFTAPNTTSLMVDSQVPTVSSRTPPTLKAYVSGETISISVTYSEAITVDTTGGTPYIGVDFSVGTDNLAYVSGSGTTTLVFSRTLDGTHFDMDGLNSSVTTITTNGGTLQDVGRNNAPTTFTSVALSSVYVTYPEIKLWAQSSFVNLAPPAGATTISNVGAVTTAACGTGTCRVFNGDDSLNLTGNLTGVETVFMAFRTPAALAGDQDIFSTDISLWDRTTDFDMRSTSATITLNGVTYNTNDVNHDTNIPTSTLGILQVDYQTPQNYGAELLIDTSFTGYIGEVIAVEGTLNGTQKSNILNYLDTKY